MFSWLFWWKKKPEAPKTFPTPGPPMRPRVNVVVHHGSPKKTPEEIPEEAWEQAFLGATAGMIDKHFFAKVVGVSYANADGVSRQQIVQRCKPNDGLIFQPQPEHPKFPEAVSVWTTGASGEKVGYLDSRAAGEIFRSIVREGRLWGAMVSKVFPAGEGRLAGMVIVIYRLSPEYAKRVTGGK